MFELHAKKIKWHHIGYFDLFGIKSTTEHEVNKAGQTLYFSLLNYGMGENINLIIQHISLS